MSEATNNGAKLIVQSFSGKSIVLTRPQVSREEFEKITCNRCGACCEVLWQPSPLDMAMLIGRNLIPAKVLAWWSDLEPVGTTDLNSAWTNAQQYRCLRFVRDAEGQGVCTQYDARPPLCANFPYGRPVRTFEDCSWNVTIVGEEDIPTV
jgi:hypothetical protein